MGNARGAPRPTSKWSREAQASVGRAPHCAATCGRVRAGRPAHHHCGHGAGPLRAALTVRCPVLVTDRRVVAAIPDLSPDTATPSPRDIVGGHLHVSRPEGSGVIDISANVGMVIARHRLAADATGTMTRNHSHVHGPRPRPRCRRHEFPGSRAPQAGRYSL